MSTTIIPQPGAASLRTRNGSILDDNSVTTATSQDDFNVQAVDVNLDANGGGIGSGTNFLEIESSFAAAGHLTALAKFDVFIDETTG